MEDIYKQFLKDNKMELKIYYSSLKGQISHTLSHLNNRVEEVNKREFINAWIIHLEEQKHPLNKLAKDEDVLLINKTIAELKEYHLKNIQSLKVFRNKDAEDKYIHITTYFKGEVQDDFSFLYHKLSNPKSDLFLIKCNREDYAKYVRENHCLKYNKVKGISNVHNSADREDRFNRAIEDF